MVWYIPVALFYLSCCWFIIGGWRRWFILTRRMKMGQKEFLCFIVRQYDSQIFFPNHTTRWRWSLPAISVMPRLYRHRKFESLIAIGWWLILMLIEWWLDNPLPSTTHQSTIVRPRHGFGVESGWGSCTHIWGEFGGSPLPVIFLSNKIQFAKSNNLFRL